MSAMRKNAKCKMQNAKVSYALALVLFALGLMAKPMLVTLPFVLLLLDWWPLGRMRMPALDLNLNPNPNPKKNSRLDRVSP